MSAVDRIARAFAGPVMAAAGVLHFVIPRTYEAIMPDWCPAHRELVYASGVAETVPALLTLHPATRRPAGWVLMATLVGVFPANVHMAIHPDRYPEVPGGQAGLFARLPVQAVMIWLVWRATQRER